MSRRYLVALLVPAILLTLNALSILVAAGPCTPGDVGCPQP
jgi:hypothetical protein